jgi:hypothetical protein
MFMDLHFFTELLIRYFYYITQNTHISIVQFLGNCVLGF